MTVLRPGTIYGPHPGVREWSLVERVHRGERRLPLPDGGVQLFHRVAVERVAAAVVPSLTQSPVGFWACNVVDPHDWDDSGFARLVASELPLRTPVRPAEQRACRAMLTSAVDLRVPSSQRVLTEGLFALTDAFCAEALDNECAGLCRRLTARLARKRPSPLRSGRPESWAAGVVTVIARVNFLFDASPTPHVSADDIARAFGVAKSTASAKATRIETLLGLQAFEPELTLRAMVDAHPLAWLVAVDGVIVDARSLPVELQRQAHQQGLIPALVGEAPPLTA